MKALVYREGRVQSGDEPLPMRGAGEALVRVSLAGICATDLEIIKGYMGFEGILGHEFTGIVEQSDDPAQRGRRVTGEINIGCGECDFCVSPDEGLGRHCPARSVLGIAGKSGAFAEYLTLPAANLHPVPDSVSDEEAVFVEPLAAAFEIVEQVPVKDSDRVCVIGDGRLGLLAAQVMAQRTPLVLAAGRHPENLAILSARGIETRLIDIADEAVPIERRFDIVVECSGSAAGLETAMRLVRPRGTVVLKTTIAGERRLDFNRLVIDEITLVGSRCGPFGPAIEALAKGSIDVKSLISATYPLEEGVAALSRAAEPGVIKVLLAVS